MASRKYRHPSEIKAGDPILCPHCCDTTTGRYGKCDVCWGAGRVGGKVCGNCQGKGSPICCRCEGTRVTPFDPSGDYLDPEGVESGWYDPPAPRKKRRRGLSGDITRVERCIKCRKLVRSDRLTAHLQAHIDQSRANTAARERETGVERIERIFTELEHLQTHNDPDCPDCQRIASKTETATIRQVRSGKMELTSGAVSLFGTRKTPHDKNAWTYMIFVGSNESSRIIGRYDTEKAIMPMGYSWWYNEGAGYDEGGNNRAAYLFDTLVRYGIIDSADIEGTRDNPLYRAKMGPDLGEEP